MAGQEGILIYDALEKQLGLKVGIKGSWDFTLAFSSSWGANAGAGGGMVPPSGSGQPAADPNGAISFFDAVDKQLGLKLEKEKRSLPVLVIDHIDEQPTEN